MYTPKGEDEGTVSYLLGGERRTILARTYLQHCWSGGLDSACMICGQDFAPPNEPPIRTFTHDIDSGFNVDNHSSTLTPRLILRFFNRHLTCIVNAGVQFVPVSHVWHEAVAVAHTSRVANNDAKTMVIEIPWKIATTARKAYGSGVEIWHDYISIPQWQPNIQQRLLLQLPNLFSWAETCLIHLDEVSSESVKIMLKPELDSEGSNKIPENKIQEIENFGNARWYNRMWCALEYGHCNRPCLLTKDYEAVANDSTLKESFTLLERICNSGLVQIIEDTGMKEYFPGDVIESRNLRRGQGLSFGDVYNLITEQGCRDPKDRYLAVASLLDLAPYHVLCQELAGKSLENTCHWVWKATIEQGDCGPLLLHRANVFGPKYADRSADYYDIARGRWFLGDLVNPPSSRVWLSSDPVLRLRLESVGKIEQLLFRTSFDTKEEQMALVSKIFDLALSCHSARTPQGFFAAMLRVFSVPSELALQDHFPMKFQEFENSIPGFAADLEILIRDFMANTNNQTHRHRILYKLVMLLRLAPLVPTGRHHPMSALDFFKVHEPQHYKVATAVVRCHGCREPFPYHLQALDQVSETAEIYRIPGLEYSYSRRNGVGIVVSTKHIVGCMAFGTPACDCNQSVDIELA